MLAVINATYAVAKRKPEKIRLAGIRTLTSAIPVQRSNQVVLICLILREIKLHENTTKRFDFNDYNVVFLKN